MPRDTSTHGWTLVGMFEFLYCILCFLHTSNIYVSVLVDNEKLRTPHDTGFTFLHTA